MLAAAFRVVPHELKTLEELGLPESLVELTKLPRGLVVVTGPTGSGKSTTLAAMIDEINRTRRDHIITVEDPIEFLHRHKRCIVNQREIGNDASGFAAALRAALRQDPDVILVGEMRDLETIATALTAAETGHLVFGTLHTQSASSTIDRIIDVFPAAQQDQIRAQIAGSLQGVVTQALMPTADGRSRVAALEILVPDDAIRNLIRQAKVEQIYSYMQTGSRSGMQTLEQSLADLVVRRVVTADDAIGRSSRRDELLGLLQRAGVSLGWIVRRSGSECKSHRTESRRRLTMGDKSIWKKEIHLGKRTGEPAQATPPPRFEEKKDSIWHRELTFRRSDKAESEQVAEAVAEGAPASEPAAQVMPPTVAIAHAHEAAIQPVELTVQAPSPNADPPVVGPPSRFALAAPALPATRSSACRRDLLQSGLHLHRRAECTAGPGAR